ncbi:MAG: 3-deoxy-7-phosphoheptulonate synthase [Gammaproteobacteria bacterium]|nr:3-deoxy-7-phosphoheptulonate synthase [Gammaproteobacteria bacterium]MDH3465043.1 3-deoxy-7-phosphoheptulonate synthase [Gammaproteobacteria bacterium]
MIVILNPDTRPDSRECAAVLDFLRAKPGITPRVHHVTGTQQVLTEIYLVGDTASLDRDEIESLPDVERVVRVSREYRVLGRHRDDTRAYGFTYNGIRFDQDSLHVFAGLCAVDTREHVEQMMQALQQNGQQCTRMGAYKPRTSPYSFQGLGASCLPWIFELAGKYDIKVMAMEVTHDSHVDEIMQALEAAGRPTGVMLQIGTRNTQNFELLKTVGRQQELPVLIKRGFGITIDESLNAAEYLASEGNRKVIFCLRGMKSNLGDPHRNFVDFTHVPVVKHLTLMPVCIDPSHSVGTRNRSSDGLMDLMHATAQGVIAGANMVLVDFHPAPHKALVDGPQALHLDELEIFLQDVDIARKAYIERRALAERLPQH